MKTPHEYAEDLMTLAEEFSRYSGEYAQCIKLQADFCNASKSDYKSDTATQRAFEGTTEGVKMSVLKMKLKALEKQMSAIRTYLRHAEIEAKNLY